MARGDDVRQFGCTTDALAATGATPQCFLLNVVVLPCLVGGWFVVWVMAHGWAGYTDRVNIGVLTQWVSAGVVESAVVGRARRDRRPNALPTRFMVYFLLALALFSQDSYEDVAENLVSAIPELSQGSMPTAASFLQARRRLGEAAMEAVFRQVTGPVATENTVGAWWRGRRVCAIDGFVLDVPDTKANRGVFGGPTGGRDQTRELGYPQVRVVTLTEAGTRAVLDASFGPYTTGERELAAALAVSMGPGMLVVFDRGFPSVKLWRTFDETQSGIVMRATKTIAHRNIRPLSDGSYLAEMWEDGQVGKGEPVVLRVIEYQVDDGETIRLLTNLLDPGEAPAAEIAALYGQRWESEGSNRQMKTYQQGPEAVLRSGDPALVRQEIWAHLTVNHCLSRLTVLIADQRGIDPDKLSFTKILKEARRTVIRQATDTIMAAIDYATGMAADLRRFLHRTVPNRHADRTLKRSRRRYPTRKPALQRQPITTKTPPKTITLIPILQT
jgi:hypothetical protein